jgi:hypothetical protein
MFESSKRLLMCIVACSVFAAGCTTVNPYTRETQTSKVVKGSALGAAAGAVAGLLTKAAWVTTWTCRRRSCAISWKAPASA